MKRKIGIMILLLMLLCSCKKQEPEPGFDLGGKTYYNTVDNYGNENHSKLWFGKDGSFVLTDNFYDGYYDITGSWSLKEDVCTLDVETTGVGTFSTILFEVKDDETLILKTNLAGSVSGDTFSIHEVKGPTNDDSGKKDDTDKNEIPCTKIETLYNNYWAEEGTKSWHLDIKPVPENTTDKMTFKSNDESIVTIDENGNVTTGAIGKTTIDVVCGDQKITVGFETRADGPKSLTLDASSVAVMMGSKTAIKVKTDPEGMDTKLTFTSADSDIATVDKDGNVTGVFPGLTKITVKAENGVSTVCDVCVEGETVVFEMENNVSVNAGSGEKIPYKAYWIMCYDGSVTTTDITDDVEFHTAYTSALDIDGHGNVYAKGSIYETTDVPVYFSYSDGSMLYVESETFYVHVVK
ncbi:MAG: Ig-like domain-containing protein [Erysipelotrichaceae bacterium]|nr:Ig-like domain-containing protein [Erysipelotrichaceae bacterium]